MMIGAQESKDSSCFVDDIWIIQMSKFSIATNLQLIEQEYTGVNIVNFGGLNWLIIYYRF